MSYSDTERQEIIKRICGLIIQDCRRGLQAGRDILRVEIAKKTAPAQKNPIGAPSFTDEQIAFFKSKVVELVPQGWTVRQVLAEFAQEWLKDLENPSANPHFREFLRAT